MAGKEGHALFSRLELVQKLVPSPVLVGSRTRIGGKMHYLVSVPARVRRPWRKIRAVRIAGLREIRPVRTHQVRHLPVLRPPRQPPRRQDLKDVFNLRRVRCRRLRQRQGLIEPVPEDRRFPRLELHLDPLPCAIGDEPVAGQILRRSLDLGIGRRRIDLQKGIGLVAVECADARGEVLSGRVGQREDRPVAAFIRNRFRYRQSSLGPLSLNTMSE
jgi:hypothetical protein